MKTTVATASLGSLLVTFLLSLAVSASALADDAARPNAVTIELGGQVRLAKYRTGLKLAGGYARYLSGITWLDLGAGVVVHKETNLTLDGGVRWKFGPTKSGVRAFLRAGGELAFLFEGKTRAVIAGRGGGGAGYYWTPDVGAIIEATVSVGPCFGDGVSVASALDILVGVEFPF